MPKPRKTRQGVRGFGMTIPEGLRLTSDPAKMLRNVSESISNLPTEDGYVQMPLNRAMRRFAKHNGHIPKEDK